MITLEFRGKSLTSETRSFKFSGRYGLYLSSLSLKGSVESRKVNTFVSTGYNCTSINFFIFDCIEKRGVSKGSTDNLSKI